MIQNENLLNKLEIENRIFTVRGVQVMIDSHLAELYAVEKKIFNQAVKRNIDRFPDAFRFQLTLEETVNLRSQFVTSSLAHGGRRYLPFVFTEQGVAMLSAVLRSEMAVKVSIQIIQAFVEMRKFISDNYGIFHRLDKIEQKQLEADANFERIFLALENKDLKPEKGIFFEGQVFDAYTFVVDLVRSAERSIVLIDNYIDDSVLTLFTRRKKDVLLTIYTSKISKQLALDVEKFNKQYGALQLKEFKESHDRFLIVDDTQLYHIGASLKDVGKKWFAFSKMNTEVLLLPNKLKEI